MNDHTQRRLEFEKRLDTIIGGYSYAQDGGYGGYEFKDITDHIDTFIAQAEQEGYERGKLSEIENSAVGDIKIVSDKVEQIKAQAIAEERARVVGEIRYILDFAELDKEMAEDPEDPKVRINYFRARLEYLLSSLDKEINNTKE